MHTLSVLCNQGTKTRQIMQKIYKSRSMACTIPISIDNYNTSIMTPKILEIKTVFKGLQTLYDIHLPKADPALVHDLLIREEEKSIPAPFYMVEIFTKEGTDSELMRNWIIEKTQMVPAIYDKGTHYVTNQRLTLEMVKEISDDENVLEVTGEYTGGIGGWGASHEHREHRHIVHNPLTSATTLTM